jgi:hypothetical protein
LTNVDSSKINDGFFAREKAKRVKRGAGSIFVESSAVTSLFFE